MKQKQIRNSLILIITAFIWGVSFVSQSTGGDAMGPYAFNCIRSFIGATFILLIMFVSDKIGLGTMKPETKEEKKTLIKGGILCGIFLCLATNLQQLGIYLGTSAGKAGFLTTCYILLVPILGLFFKKKCGLNIWIGVLFAVAGLYFLCIKGSFSIGLSDGLVMICAFIFAGHILVVDHFSPLVDGVRLSFIQFLTCGIITAVPMFIVDMKHSIAGIIQWAPTMTTSAAWISLLYAGIMSCGVAYTLQIIGQNGLNPTVASLLMSLESVFSVVAGWIILNEKMGPRELFGCALIFVAIVLAQIPFQKKKSK